MKYALTFALLIGFGCASAHLTDGAQRVRIVKNTPQNCKYITEVKGADNGDSVSAGIYWAHGDGRSTDNARVDLKNEAAKVGADTVEVTLSGEGWYSGEAYNCNGGTGFTPAPASN